MTVLQNIPLVSISTLTGKKFALKGVKNTIQVLFSIVTNEVQTRTRLPVNLAIVLDRSGSMSDEKKLENSKEAIIGIIGQLQAEDVVHLVCYDSHVETIFSNEKITSDDDKERLTQLVSPIKPKGQTYLSQGLVQGIKCVQDYSRSNQGKHMNNRVFLFSDGLANRGYGAAELFQLAQKVLETFNIGITTFGIGSDFDQNMMQGIADRGGGRFYYIRNGERIGYFVEQAHESLTATIGVKAKLSIRGKGCGIVTKIWGQQDPTQGAMIGDLFSNNTRNILVELELSPSENTSETEEVLSYHFEFIPLTSESDPDPESSKLEELNGTVKMNFTINESELEKSIDNQVEVIHRLQIVAEDATKSLEMMKNDRVEEALELRKKSLQILKEVEEFDVSGQVATSIRHLEATIKEMRSKGATKEVIARTHWIGYTFKTSDWGYTAGYHNDNHFGNDK